MRSIGRRAALAAPFVVAALPARAAEFPERPVRLVVPAAAGGTADILARSLAQRLSEAWRQPVVVDNRAGAGGAIGADAVAKAPADGYTIGLFSSSHAINPVVMRDLPYDTFRDLIPVAPVATAPGLLVVNRAAMDVPDLRAALDRVRARPGAYNYASPVALTAGHRSMALLAHTAGLDIQHVPYRGGAPAVTDLVAGQVQFLVIAIPSVIGQVQAGTVKALAVTSRERFEGLPDVPTVAESGFPGFESIEWYGVFTRAGAPPAAVERVSADLRRILSDPAVRRGFVGLGAVAATGGPEVLDRMQREEYARWRDLAPVVGLRAD